MGSHGVPFAAEALEAGSFHAARTSGVPRVIGWRTSGEGYMLPVDAMRG